MGEALSNMLNTTLGSGSVLVYVILFAGGVVAGFTPCVYPVLPLTVGYVGSQASGKKAMAFVLSLSLVLGMAFVYAVVGVVFAAVGTPFGMIMGKGWVLYAIAMFFILMSLFLMDVFTFPAPRFLSGLNAKVGTSRRGVLGALVVGGVSGLVVGPCTGPILAGVLAYIVAGLKEAEGLAYVGQVLGGGLKLFVFGLGQGSLILLCGTFAGLLTRLPKAGQWMVTLKKGFALIILLGASLMLVYVGQNSDFPQLSRLLAAAEGGDRSEATQTEPSTQQGEFGGDEFLD